MSYTEARKRANRKWDKDNMARLSVAMRKTRQEEIIGHTKLTGESVNAFINRAIRETMERDGYQEPGGGEKDGND